MHKIRVYVDTSVFGGIQDEEFAEASRNFFERVKQGQYVLLISEITLKTKTFDCVEMKNRIQAERMAEYESRKDEFPSFLDFVRARSHESKWLQQVRKRFGWHG